MLYATTGQAGDTLHKDIIHNNSYTTCVIHTVCNNGQSWRLSGSLGHQPQIYFQMKESHVSHSWSETVLLRSLFCFTSLPGNSHTYTFWTNKQELGCQNLPLTTIASFPRLLGKDLCFSKSHCSLMCPVPEIYHPRQVKVLKPALPKSCYISSPSPAWEV